MSDLTWTNETRRLGDLKPQEDNPRLIREKQAERLNESWDEYGQVDLLAVGPDGEIYNGHQRYYVLLDRHGPDHPVECRIASRPLERREWQRLTVLLHEGATGEWDFDGLANWEGVDFSDLVEWGFDADKLGVVIEQEPPADPCPQIDRAEELRDKWGTERGQIWQIGKHRLMCGDSTTEEDVGRLMDGQRAHLVMTSPPYWVGMEYESQANQSEILNFISATIGAWLPTISRDLSRIIINTGTGRATASTLKEPSDPETWLLLDWWRDALLTQGWKLRHIRVWIKRGGFAAPRGPESDIIDQHWEFIGTFYDPSGKKRGQNRVSEPWAQMGYWDDIKGEARQAGHVASFPVELPFRCLELYGDHNNPCADWFIGAGTTMVAAEQTGRICYGMEIEPKYVAVTLERMAGMGLEPKLVES